MRFSHGYLIACTVACMAFAAATIHAVTDFALRAVDYVLSMFPPGKNLALASVSFGVVRNDAGSAICSALQNDMRHESRTSRIGAPRHT